jgi:hypothetical protein
MESQFLEPEGMSFSCFSLIERVKQRLFRYAAGLSRYTHSEEQKNACNCGNITFSMLHIYEQAIPGRAYKG